MRREGLRKNLARAKSKNIKAIFLLGFALNRAGRRDLLGRLGIPPQTPPAELSSLKKVFGGYILK